MVDAVYVLNYVIVKCRLKLHRPTLYAAAREVVYCTYYFFLYLFLGFLL